MAGDARVRRAAMALTGLLFLGALGVVFFAGGGEDPADQPGGEAFRQASRWVVEGQVGAARGSTPEVQAQAELLSERLASLDQLAGASVRVHAQAASAGVLFLIGLPGKRMDLAEREAFASTLWREACKVSETPGEVAVALRGKLTLVAVARGARGAEPRIESGLVVPGPLFSYFLAGKAAPVNSGVSGD